VVIFYQSNNTILKKEKEIKRDLFKLIITKLRSIFYLSTVLNLHFNKIIDNIVIYMYLYVIIVTYYL